MNILNKKLSGTKCFLYTILIVLCTGCSRPELLVPHYEMRDVESFDNLVLSGRQNSVLAQWNRLAEEDVDYVLVRFIEETATGESLQTRRFARDRTQISINNLRNFKEYEFTFMVVDSFGNTSDSIVARATPVAEIVNVFASGGSTEGSVNVIWEDPEDPFDVFSGVFFYDENDNLLGSADRGVQQITLTGLTPGQEVTIIARIRLGDDIYSEGIEIVASPRVVLPPPGEVIDLVVKGKTNIMELTWENPTDQTFAFVEIYWGAGTDASQANNRFLGQPTAIPGGRMKVLIPNLTNGTQYVVLIKTSDVHGNASDGIVGTGTPKNTTHVGNISIMTQGDADAFNEDITYIQGNLNIDITAGSLPNLDNFKNLDSISGTFHYRTNSAWSYVEQNDFENLQKVGSNITITGIYTGGADITFPILKHAGGDFIVSYSAFRSLSVPVLERVGGQMYFLGTGANLLSLDFSSLERVGGRLLFANMPSLTNLNGFSSLNHVGGDFVIGTDPWGATTAAMGCGFTNLCGVRPLMQTGTITGTVNIARIPLAPISRAEIAAGNCSQ